MLDISTLINNLILHGLEFIHIYPGLYRGNVTRNDDPDGRGRVQAFCAIVGNTPTKYPDVWMDPVTPSGTSRGQFWPPEVGDSVWISYANGNAQYPQCYLGGWYGVLKGKTEVPDEFAYTKSYPQARGLVTRMGHVLVLDDTAGSESIKLGWHKAAPGDKALTDRTVTADRTKGDAAYLEFSPDGSVTVANKDKSRLVLDAPNKKIEATDEHGNVITTDKDGIKLKDKSGNYIRIKATGEIAIKSSGAVTVESPKLVANTQLVSLTTGADSPAVRGTDLMRWLLTHTHGSAMGPTSPPVVPPPPSILAQKTKVGR